MTKIDDWKLFVYHNHTQDKLGEVTGIAFRILTINSCQTGSKLFGNYFFEQVKNLLNSRRLGGSDNR
jgi:hypothetical protein